MSQIGGRLRSKSSCLKIYLRQVYFHKCGVDFGQGRVDFSADLENVVFANNQNLKYLWNRILSYSLMMIGWERWELNQNYSKWGLNQQMLICSMTAPRLTFTVPLVKSSAILNGPSSGGTQTWDYPNLTEAKKCSGITVNWQVWVLWVPWVWNAFCVVPPYNFLCTDFSGHRQIMSFPDLRGIRPLNIVKIIAKYHSLCSFP